MATTSAQYKKSDVKHSFEEFNEIQLNNFRRKNILVLVGEGAYEVAVVSWEGALAFRCLSR